MLPHSGIWRWRLVRLVTLPFPNTLKLLSTPLVLSAELFYPGLQLYKCTAERCEVPSASATNYSKCENISTLEQPHHVSMQPTSELHGFIALGGKHIKNSTIKKHWRTKNVRVGLRADYTKLIHGFFPTHSDDVLDCFRDRILRSYQFINTVSFSVATCMSICWIVLLRLAPTPTVGCHCL